MFEIMKKGLEQRLVIAALIQAETRMTAAANLMLESEDDDQQLHGRELSGAALVVGSWIEYLKENQENSVNPLDKHEKA